jgi:hypothetical protein
MHNCIDKQCPSMDMHGDIRDEYKLSVLTGVNTDHLVNFSTAGKVLTVILLG